MRSQRGYVREMSRGGGGDYGGDYGGGDLGGD